MLTERILEELYDKKKEWYYVIMDICILQMSYEEAAKHLNIEVQVLPVQDSTEPEDIFERNMEKNIRNFNFFRK